MTPKLRSLLVLLMLVASFAAIGSRPASACTCATFDTRRAVADAPGAFVGRLMPDVIPSPDQQAETRIFQFRVDEVVKGPFEQNDVVEVRSASSPASCGLSASAQEPVGLILQKDGSQWTGSLCQQVDPARLLRVREPLPNPDGTPPASVVIESTYGLGRSFGLDNQGRLTSYGPGMGRTDAAAICPQGPRRSDGTFPAARLVELFLIPGEGGPVPAVAVRDAETLTLVFEASLPDYRGAQAAAGSIGCRDPEGTDLVVALSDLTARKGRIVRVLNGTHRLVWEGDPPLWSSFGPAAEVAWLNLGVTGEDLRKVDLNKIDEVGTFLEAVPVATLPAGSGPMAPSPDGRHLATVSVGTNQRSQVVLVDLEGATASDPPPIIRRSELSAAGVAGQMVWSTSDRVAFTPRLNRGELVRVFDTKLQPQAAWGDWAAEHSVATSDGRLFGASQGKVWQANLVTGNPTLMREIEDALVFSLVDPTPVSLASQTPIPVTPASVPPTTTTTGPRPEGPSGPGSSSSTTTTTARATSTSTTTAPARDDSDPEDQQTSTSAGSDGDGDQAAPFPTSSGRDRDGSSSGAGWPAFLAGMLAMGAVLGGAAWQMRVRRLTRTAGGSGPEEGGH